MAGIMSAIGSIFKPKMPKIESQHMPDPASPAAKIKAREDIAKKNKGGRESTIFTDQPYSRASLG